MKYDENLLTDPGLSMANVMLSRLLDDDDAGNDEIRYAAGLLCETINARLVLPPDPEMMNEDRSRRAGLAINAFITETGTAFESGLGDLLTNLMHWSDRHNFNFDAELDRARRHYHVETSDPA